MVIPWAGLAEIATERKRAYTQLIDLAAQKFR
jgi:hypothetical protein